MICINDKFTKFPDIVECIDLFIELGHGKVGISHIIVEDIGYMLILYPLCKKLPIGESKEIYNLNTDMREVDCVYLSFDDFDHACKVSAALTNQTFEQIKTRWLKTYYHKYVIEWIDFNE